jgi:MYXO-CTERM domain-containing protein
MKALACTLVAILATAWPPAAAVALDITFEDVMSVGNPLVTTLDTHGYRFTGSFWTIDTPGTTLASNASAVYLGQPASGPGITVTRADGGPFSLYEFDAAGLYLPASAGPASATEVSLVGYRVNGAILGASYRLSGLAQFVHFSVPSTWVDLQAVTFAGILAAATPGALALDDVGVGEGPTNVAEPGTLGLAMLTALGVGAAVLTRRRRGRSFRHH